jgi:Putative peptidoglycan binding domain
VQVAELYLVLEGEKAGLPIYCSEFPEFRIDGRAIPGRLVLDPVAAGMKGAEIHWVDLRPTATGQPWRRMLLPRGDNRWTIDVLQFDGPAAPGIDGTEGTGRYAAAILPPGKPASGLLETDGWTIRPGWNNPEQAPGLAITRHRGLTLSGFARGFARLPAYAGATLAHERNRVALRPTDLAILAYEDYGQIQLDGRDEPLDSESWSWLFDVIVPHGVHRTSGEGVAIGDRGRPIPWSTTARTTPTTLRGDDVVLFDDSVAILLSDDGDGWLGNADWVLDAASGEVKQEHFGDVPGEKFRVVRPRSFSQLRVDLRAAGYGELGRAAPYTPELKRAIQEFEGDHGLPVDGIPDPAMLSTLADFLQHLGHPSPSAPSHGT